MKTEFSYTIAMVVCILLIMANWILWQFFYSVDVFRFMHLILSMALTYIIGLHTGWQKKCHSGDERKK